MDYQRSNLGSAKLIEKRQCLLGPAYRLFYDEPLHIVRGEDVYLYDSNSRRYLDAYNNVASVGHCHPYVVEAIARQAGVLNTHTRYLHEGIVQYAERLLSYMPDGLSNVMFTCSGSEANDLALRVARQHTQNEGIIVTSFAYHGVTAALAELSPSLGAASGLGKHIVTIPAPDSYRTSPEYLSTYFEKCVRQAIDELIQTGTRPAALLVDSVFASDGVYVDPPGFWRGAVEAVRQAGGLFIADEVQSGFGRSGRMWGFQRHGISPDIVTMGKPMANGHPVAAMVCRPEILASFGSATRYFNTFGGNPVSMAAATAVLDVIESEQLLMNADRVGRYLRRRLEILASKQELIGDIRGLGLYHAVELVVNRQSKVPASILTKTVVNEMRNRGVLINSTGNHANVLKIRPPLVFKEIHVDILVDTLGDVLTGVSPC